MTLASIINLKMNLFSDEISISICGVSWQSMTGLEISSKQVSSISVDKIVFLIFLDLSTCLDCDQTWSDYDVMARNMMAGFRKNMTI